MSTVRTGGGDSGANDTVSKFDAQSVLGGILDALLANRKTIDVTTTAPRRPTGHRPSPDGIVLHGTIGMGAPERRFEQRADGGNRQVPVEVFSQAHHRASRADPGSIHDEWSCRSATNLDLPTTIASSTWCRRRQTRVAARSTLISGRGDVPHTVRDSSPLGRSRRKPHRKRLQLPGTSRWGGDYGKLSAMPTIAVTHLLRTASKSWTHGGDGERPVAARRTSWSASAKTDGVAGMRIPRREAPGGADGDSRHPPEGSARREALA
jgi:hypothetical protein